MKTNPTDKEWREHKNKPADEGSKGNPEPANDTDRPNDRLKDGTNDLQNGDQDPASASSQKPDGETGKA